jgi:hypothetical protein
MHSKDECTVEICIVVSLSLSYYLTLYFLSFKVLSSSVGDPDPDDPHVFLSLPDPDPFVKGTERYGSGPRPGR